MTNVSGTPKKRATRRGLFAFAIGALEKEGWTVSRVPRGGKASLREIRRGDECWKVSIRTSQDAWIAFPRKRGEDGWVTLDDVDFVVASSVNDRHNPTIARVHMVPGDDARARFNRAYAARRKADHVIPEGRGIWLSLYEKEVTEPVSYVGGGIGLAWPAIAELDLTRSALPTGDGELDDDAPEDDADDTAPPALAAAPVDAPLSIPEAKRRLAVTLGVPESAIKISIEH